MISFLNPILAVFGIACIAAPIIIHILFRRRRQPVSWGAMRFIQEAYRRQRRRMNFEQILLLFSRCLLVLLVALAVGKPLLAGSTGGVESGPRTLYVIIDNSLAGGVITPDSRREFDYVIEQANNLVGTLDASRGDRVAVITTAAAAEAVVVPPTAQISTASSIISGIALTDCAPDWTGALSIVTSDVSKQESGPATLALLSAWRGDLRSVITQSTLRDSRLQVLISPPATQAVDNITVTSVRPARTVIISSTASRSDVPSGDAAGLGVQVTLTRSGGAHPLTTGITVRVLPLVGQDSKQPVSSQVSWAEGQSTAEVYITLPQAMFPRDSALSDRSAMAIAVTIDNDAIEADNTAYAALVVRDQIEAAVIASKSDSMGRIGAFGPADWFRLLLAPAADLSLLHRQGGDIRLVMIDPAQGISPSPSRGGSGRSAGILTSYDVVVVAEPDALDVSAWQAVKEKLDSGSTVIINPSPVEGSQVWTDAFNENIGVPWLLSRDVTNSDPPLTIKPAWVSGQAPQLLSLIATELPELLRSVNVQRLLTVSPSVPGGGDVSTETRQEFTTLLETSDNKPFLIASKVGLGTLVYFASAMDISWTNLPACPVVVPLIQEVVRQSIGDSAAAKNITAGGVPDGALFAGAVDLLPVGDGTRAPSALAGGLPVRSAGVYSVRGGNGAAIGALVVNPDPAAGNVTLQSKEDIEQWLSPLSNQLRYLDTGTIEPRTGALAAGEQVHSNQTAALSGENPAISWPLLIAACAIGIIELIFARIFSHADQRSFSGVARKDSSTMRSREAGSEKASAA